MKFKGSLLRQIRTYGMKKFDLVGFAFEYATFVLLVITSVFAYAYCVHGFGFVDIFLGFMGDL